MRHPQARDRSARSRRTAGGSGWPRSLEKPVGKEWSCRIAGVADDDSARFRLHACPSGQQQQLGSKTGAHDSFFRSHRRRRRDRSRRWAAGSVPYPERGTRLNHRIPEERRQVAWSRPSPSTHERRGSADGYLARATLTGSARTTDAPALAAPQIARPMKPRQSSPRSREDQRRQRSHDQGAPTASGKASPARRAGASGRRASAQIHPSRTGAD